MLTALEGGNLMELNMNKIKYLKENPKFEIKCLKCGSTDVSIYMPCYELGTNAIICTSCNNEQLFYG
jgi:hypothetical protein